MIYDLLVTNSVQGTSLYENINVLQPIPQIYL